MRLKINNNVLILSQVFHPDSTAVAQHVTDLAVDLAAAGFDVTVLTSRRCYDNPQKLYASNEIYKDIKITRLPITKFGKKTKWSRIFDAVIFFVSVFWYLLTCKKFEIIIGVTSPPLIAFPCAIYNLFRGGLFIYWIMDMNPDLAIQAGLIKRDSFLSYILEGISRFCFRQSSHIIVLDRFMQQRIINKGIDHQKITISPPWSYYDVIHCIDHEKNPFRVKYNLTDKFVIMYSGNHSIVHSLDTLLETALKLKNDSRYIFLFIGWGVGVKKVVDFKQKHLLKNIIYLTTQPIDELSYSLSAADLHVIVMGNDLVGIVHPCKIYGVLTVGRPFVFIGPETSHVGDIISIYEIGHQIKHGQPERLIDVIYTIDGLKDREKDIIAQKSVEIVKNSHSRQLLSNAVISIIRQTK